MDNDMKTGQEMEADIIAGLPNAMMVRMTRDQVQMARQVLSHWHSKPSNIFKKEPPWLPIIRTVAQIVAVLNYNTPDDGRDNVTGWTNEG